MITSYAWILVASSDPPLGSILRSLLPLCESEHLRFSFVHFFFQQVVMIGSMIGFTALLRIPPIPRTTPLDFPIHSTNVR